MKALLAKFISWFVSQRDKSVPVEQVKQTRADFSALTDTWSKFSDRQQKQLDKAEEKINRQEERIAKLEAEIDDLHRREEECQRRVMALTVQVEKLTGSDRKDWKA